MMVALRDNETSWHLSRLAKSSDTTYVHVTKLVTDFQKNGLVTVEHVGKKRIVKLTEKGVVVANAIHELMNRLED
jgi:predicted transcriptional regulator